MNDHISAWAEVVYRESLTAPMTVHELSGIFGLGYRRVKAYLAELPDVERVGSCYRLPVRCMPAKWLVSCPILAEYCAAEIESTDPMPDEIQRDY